MLTWCAAFDPEVSKTSLQLVQHAPQSRLKRFEDASVSVLFDGWLYRAERLAHDLGLSPKTMPAELVAHGFRTWGEGLLDKLEGAYTLILLERERRKLFCARDPGGVQPLFYASQAGGYFFSTSVDSLLRLLQVDTSVHQGVLATYLYGKLQDPRRTFFKNIKRVLPGYLLTVENSHVQERRYWQPVADWKNVDWVGPEEAATFPSLLAEAVADTLQLGQSGLYLSGGLDSGMIATVAASVSGKQGLRAPRALSLVYDDAEANEETAQKAIATALGLEHTLISSNDADLFGNKLERALALNRTWPHPLITGLGPLHLSLGGHAAALGCDVMLWGEGGDEWFDIHPSLSADYLREFNIPALARLWRTVRSSYALSPLQSSHYLLLEKGLKPLVVDALGSALGHLAPRLRDERRARGLEARLPAWLAPDPDVRAYLHSQLNSRAQPFRTAYEKTIMQTVLEHPLTVLYKEDNFLTGLITGVPLLEPFYAPKVVSFLARTPPELRALGGVERGMQRSYLDRRHPQLGYGKNVKPFATSFVNNQWLDVLGQVWKTLRQTNQLAALGIIDVKAADKLVRETLARPTAVTMKQVRQLINAEVWARARSGAPDGLPF